MKKFKILYMLIFIFIAIMILTDGVPGNLNIYSYNYADYGWTDGLQGNLYLSIINCFVILIIIMFMFIFIFILIQILIFIIKYHLISSIFSIKAILINFPYIYCTPIFYFLSLQI